MYNLQMVLTGVRLGTSFGVVHSFLHLVSLIQDTRINLIRSLVIIIFVDLLKV